MSNYTRDTTRGLDGLIKLLSLAVTQADDQPSLNKKTARHLTRYTTNHVVAGVVAFIIVFGGASAWWSNYTPADYTSALNQVAAMTAYCKNLDPAATLKEAILEGSPLATTPRDLTHSQQLHAIDYLLKNFDTDCLSRS